MQECWKRPSLKLLKMLECRSLKTLKTSKRQNVGSVRRNNHSRPKVSNRKTRLGQMVIWTVRQSDIRTINRRLGHPDNWKFGHSGIQSCGQKDESDIWKKYKSGNRTFGRLDDRTSRQSDTQTFADIWTIGNTDIRTLRQSHNCCTCFQNLSRNRWVHHHDFT